MKYKVAILAMFVLVTIPELQAMENWEWFDMHEPAYDRGIRSGMPILSEKEQIQRDFGLAAELGCQPQVEEMLEKGAEIDKPYYTRYTYSASTTALIRVVRDGRENMVEFLLSKRASANATTDKGDSTPLIAAINYKYRDSSDISIKMVTLLLIHKAQVNVHTQDGHSPLIASSSGGYNGATRLLLLHSQMDDREVNYAYAYWKERVIIRDPLEHLTTQRWLLYHSHKKELYKRILESTNLVQDTAEIVAGYGGHYHYVPEYLLPKDKPAEAQLKRTNELLTESEKIYTPQFREKLDYIEKMKVRYPQRKTCD